MFIRKVVKSGLASFTVALPKEWIIKNKIKKGEVLYLSELEDGMLITPEPRKEKIIGDSVIINVDEKDERSLIRAIISCYLNNSSSVLLKGENIPKFSNIIKQTANSLIGFELIEEESNKIIIKNFVQLADSNPNQILRRIDNTIRSMILDSKEVSSSNDLADSLSERDKSVNRFVFLLTRIVKAAIKDPNIARELQLKPIDVLFYWELALHLEKLGDGIKRYARVIKGCNAKTIIKVNEIISEFNNLYENSMKSFYQKDIKISDVVASSRINLLKKCDLFESQFKGIETSNFANKIRAMTAHVVDISYLARYT